MPPEWTRHERTLMSWPVLRSLWGDAFEDAKDEYAATARVVARFEPVTLVVRPGDEADAARRCGPRVDIVSLPIDDSWMRDSGPAIVFDPRGSRAGIQFRFDAYGGRFPHANDARVATRVLDHLGIPFRRSSMTFEGGAVTVDGEGALIATKQCLLRSNRNRGWSRERVESELRAHFAVRRFVWLPWGRAEDMHTDGHVDFVCMFVRPGAVVAQGCADIANPNHARMRANLRTLRRATDAQGRALEVVELPMSPLVDCHGTPVMVSHLNFYLCNNAVIVPLAETADDARALAVIARALPEREVVGVPARALALGGGGVHCITQQVPACTVVSP